MPNRAEWHLHSSVHRVPVIQIIVLAFLHPSQRGQGPMSRNLSACPDVCTEFCGRSLVTGEVTKNRFFETGSFPSLAPSLLASPRSRRMGCKQGKTLWSRPLAARMSGLVAKQHARVQIPPVPLRFSVGVLGAREYTIGVWRTDCFSQIILDRARCFG